MIVRGKCAPRPAQRKTCSVGTSVSLAAKKGCEVIVVEGASGADGTTPTVGVGTVETLPEGEDARVTTTPTPTGVDLNFFLPRGEEGPEGPQGPSGDAFIPDFEAQVVSVQEGEEADAGVAVITTEDEVTFDFSFTLPRGEEGPEGPAGPPGEDGVSPTVTVGDTLILPSDELPSVEAVTEGANTELIFSLPRPPTFAVDAVDVGTPAVAIEYDEEDDEWVFDFTLPEPEIPEFTATLTATGPEEEPDVVVTGTDPVNLAFSMPIITSAEATTLPAGEDASAELVAGGVDGGTFLSLGIPAGETGPEGPPGEDGVTPVVTVAPAVVVDYDVPPSVTSSETEDGVELTFSLPQVPTFSVNADVQVAEVPDVTLAEVPADSNNLEFTFTLPEPEIPGFTASVEPSGPGDADVDVTGTDPVNLAFSLPFITAAEAEIAPGPEPTVALEPDIIGGGVLLRLGIPPGETGPEGPPGEDALEPNFGIGTVDSGPAPAVTLTGTYPDLDLNFTLEPGPEGEPGDTPVVTVSPTTVLPYDEPPSVTPTPTPEGVDLTFSLPQVPTFSVDPVVEVDPVPSVTLTETTPNNLEFAFTLPEAPETTFIPFEPTMAFMSVTPSIDIALAPSPDAPTVVTLDCGYYRTPTTIPGQDRVNIAYKGRLTFTTTGDVNSLATFTLNTSLPFAAAIPPESVGGYPMASGSAHYSPYYITTSVGAETILQASPNTVKAYILGTSAGRIDISIALDLGVDLTRGIPFELSGSYYTTEP